MVLVPPQARPSGAGILGNHEGRIRALERRPPGQWVYVGTYPTDPGATPDSPPFENGWGNAGSGQQRLRFRLTYDNQTEIDGVVSGGTDGTTVVTLPARYSPAEDQPAPGVGGDWVLQSDGSLIFTSTTGGGPGSDTTAIHWGSNTDPGLGLSVTLASGQSITIRDSSNNPILQMTEGSPDLHIPTGGNVVADL